MGTLAQHSRLLFHRLTGKVQPDGELLAWKDALFLFSFQMTVCLCIPPPPEHLGIYFIENVPSMFAIKCLKAVLLTALFNQVLIVFSRCVDLIMYFSWSLVIACVKEQKRVFQRCTPFNYRPTLSILFSNVLTSQMC